MFPAAGDGSGTFIIGRPMIEQKEGDLRVKLVSLSLGRGSFGGLYPVAASPGPEPALLKWSPGGPPDPRGPFFGHTVGCSGCIHPKGPRGGAGGAFRPSYAENWAHNP